jgi:cyanophycinase
LPEQTKIGPRTGSLLAVGGGPIEETEILRRFVALVGGSDAHITIIPTAGEGEFTGPYTSYTEDFMRAGATNLKVLHTRDRNVADSEEFASALRKAQGVWFTGGRHWRCTEAYLKTKTHAELDAVLNRGGVIGGSSAGATLQGSFMIRGDTSGPEIVIGDHTEGFGFLKNVCIDQHHLVRNRQFDMVEVIQKHPELLGIGIDEGTAVVVRGDELEVIGESYVAVYDPRKTLGEAGTFFFLRSGDRYDLAKREIIEQSPQPRGFNRLAARPV